MIQSIFKNPIQNKLENKLENNIDLKKWTKDYINTNAITFFKKITYSNQNENLKLIKAIKENMIDAFGNDYIFFGEGYDNVFICIDDIIVSCAVVEINKKFIFNLCTHSKYKKLGFAKKLMNSILDKYRNINRHQVLNLDTETNEKGILPQKIYASLNWINEKDHHSNYRNKMLFFPLTGICDTPNRLVKDELLKHGNFLKEIETKQIGIISRILDYIIGKTVELNLSDINTDYIQEEKTTDYQKLLLFKDINKSSYCSPLYNHVIFLENNKFCKTTIENIVYNYNRNPYFVIIFIYKKHFFIINKVNTDKEYVVSKKLKTFELLVNYLNNVQKL